MSTFDVYSAPAALASHPHGFAQGRPAGVARFAQQLPPVRQVEEYCPMPISPRIHEVLTLLHVLDLDSLSAPELEQLEKLCWKLAPRIRRKREKLANSRSGVLAELGGVRGFE